MSNGQLEIERRFAALILKEPVSTIAVAPPPEVFSDPFMRAVVIAARVVHEAGEIVDTAALWKRLGPESIDPLLKLSREPVHDTAEGIAGMLTKSHKTRLMRSLLARTHDRLKTAGEVDLEQLIADARTIVGGASPGRDKPADPFDTFRTLREWNVDIYAEPPEPDWLFTRWTEPDRGDVSDRVGVMECGTVAMLPGMPGLGKSTIKLACAVAVATGTKWCGWLAERPGRVIFATAEEQFPQVHRRLHRLVTALDLSATQLEMLHDNLVVWPLRGVGVGLIHGRELGYAPTRFCEQLLERCVKTPPRCVIIDPLSRFASPDVEVDNHAGTAFIAQLERLSMLPGTPTVMFTHHTGKAGANAEDDMFAARGSSSLSGGVKWQANLTTISGGTDMPRWGVKVTVTKSNWAAPAPKVWLKWDAGVLRVAQHHEIEALKQMSRRSGESSEFGA